MKVYTTSRCRGTIKDKTEQDQGGCFFDLEKYLSDICTVGEERNGQERIEGIYLSISI